MSRSRVGVFVLSGTVFVCAAASAAQETTTLFVPVILSSSGVNGSFFTSEIVETNKGAADATVAYFYTAAAGGGSGGATDPQPLAAGTQRVIPDAMSYLRGLGIPIPTGVNVVGTLRATFSNLAAASDAAITVRTTTPVPADSPTGRAGLAYAGVPPLGLLQDQAFLCGLRRDSLDRSNVAVQNAGDGSQGSVTLRLTFVPSSGGAVPPVSVTLDPGGFRQLALTDFGADAASGFVRVERIDGTAPWYAYAVVNDQVTSDGSFIPPVKPQTGTGIPALVLPTVVETATFATEVVATNLTASPVQATIVFAGDGVATADGTTSLPLSLGPFEQKTFPSFVQALRDAGAPGVPAPGGTVVGVAILRVSGGDVSGVFLGGRTLNAGGGGRYGVFTTAQPYGTGVSLLGTWLHALRQDGENRTNLALVNTGEVDGSASRYRVEIYDGRTGLLAATVENDDTTVPARGFHQINGLLSKYAPAVSQAYARVTRVTGSNLFVTYAVVNDGAQPGQRSGDGAVIAMDPFSVLRYRGTWQNQTFGSTGAAAAVLTAERISGQFTITLTLGGNVFGGTAPPPQTLHGQARADGSATIDDRTPLFGPISARVDSSGHLTGSAPSVPGPNVSAMTFTGDETPFLFNLAYNVNLRPSGSAHGIVTMVIVP